MAVDLKNIIDFQTPQGLSANDRVQIGANTQGGTLVVNSNFSSPEWYQFSAKRQMRSENRQLAESICQSIKDNWGSEAAGAARLALKHSLDKGVNLSSRDLLTATQNAADKKIIASQSLMTNLKAMNLANGNVCLAMLYGGTGTRSGLLSMMRAQTLLENIPFKEPGLSGAQAELTALQSELTNFIATSRPQAGDSAFLHNAVMNDARLYLGAIGQKLSCVNAQISSFPLRIANLKTALEMKYEAALVLIDRELTSLNNQLSAENAKLSAAQARDQQREAAEHMTNVNEINLQIRGLTSGRGKLVQERGNLFQDLNTQDIATKEQSKEFANANSVLSKKLQTLFKSIGLGYSKSQLEKSMNVEYSKILEAGPNGQGWSPIVKDMQANYHGRPLVMQSQIQPAANFGQVSSGFTDGKGVSSISTDSRHTVNLAHTSQRVQNHNGVGTTEVFSAFRHGVHSAFGISSSATRKSANEQRVNEMYISMLEKQGRLNTPNDPAHPIRLDVSSISLLTPDFFRKFGSGAESKFIEEQNAAWRNGQTLALQIPSSVAGASQTIYVKPNVITFNFGVNFGGQGLAANLGGSRLLTRGQNQVAIDQLIHKAQLFMQANPAQYPIVHGLITQIEQLWSSGDYVQRGEDPYRLPARLAVLANMIGETTAFNCKSGKDRTGQLDVECKYLATKIFQDASVPPVERSTDPDDQKLFEEIAINSGNHEMQVNNTGLAGFKNKNVKGLAQSYSDETREVYRGMSDFVKG